MKKNLFRTIAVIISLTALFFNLQIVTDLNDDSDISLKAITKMAQAQIEDPNGCPIDEEFGMTDYYCDCGVYVMRCWHCGAGCPVSNQLLCSEVCP